MKLANIVDPRLFKVLQELMAIKVPLATAIKIRATIADIDKNSVLYNTLRKELLVQHGDKNEDGSLVIDEAGNFKVGKDAMKLFTKEIGELLQKDVVIAKIPASELQNLSLSVEELMLLQDIIEL
jgi:hypothetical protein